MECRQEADWITMRGSHRTRKFTELAMKQKWWARSCSACANAASPPAAIVTWGLSVT